MLFYRTLFRGEGKTITGTPLLIQTFYRTLFRGEGKTARAAFDLAFVFYRTLFRGEGKTCETDPSIPKGRRRILIGSMVGHTLRQFDRRSELASSA